ncbi:MAG: HEAT repeat domain-containing protein [Desulfosalsimonadaceae bacterium]
MNRHLRQHLSPAVIIAAGLIVSQIFFALFVYRSNLALLDRLQSIAAAGYLTVPGPEVMAGLDRLTPAFFGALFYCLTAGAGLVFAAFLLVCLWHQLSGSRPVLLLPFLILWEIGIHHCSLTGYPFFLTAPFIFVPVFVAAAGLQWLRQHETKTPVKMLCFHGAIFLLIVCIWLPNANSGVFTKIRDRLLLSNPAGRAVNAFYYSYTLYPAEALKSLLQKQLKTSSIQVKDPDLAGRLQKPLLRMDYLPIPEKAEDVDLQVRQSGSELVLARQKNPAVRTSPARFLASPEAVLKKFSEKTDQMAFLRGFCRISLVTAAPLLLYLLVFQGFFLVFRHIPCPGGPRPAAALICLFLAASAALPLYSVSRAEKNASDTERIRALLHSHAPGGRLEAAKLIAEGGTGTEPFGQALFRLGKSPRPAVRYWAARALGGSNSSKAYKTLIKLLGDPHPNVVCAVLHSLGRHGNKAAVAPIRRLMLSSGNWYVQLYAYNALKELGWTQQPGRASG